MGFNLKMLKLNFSLSRSFSCCIYLFLVCISEEAEKEATEHSIETSHHMYVIIIFRSPFFSH